MKFWALLAALVLVSATVFSLGITNLEIKEGANVLNGTIVNKNSSDITLVLTTDGGADNNKVCFTYSASQPASCANFIDFNGTPMTVSVSTYDASLWSNDRNNSIWAVLLDGNTDVPTYAYRGAWAIDDQTAPVIGTTYPVASTDYNKADFNFSLAFSDNFSSISMIKVSVDSNHQVSTATSPATFVINNMSEGTHTVAYDVNDALGNAASGSFTFTIDTLAPTSGSISYSGWTNSEKPSFSISNSHAWPGVLMRLSCNNSSWTSWITYATTYSDFNINDTTYGCTAKSDWNKDVYVQFKDAVGNIDANLHTTYVLYDSVAPSAPTSLTITAGNGSAVLNWTAPSAADNNSGNAGYNIYRAIGAGAFTYFDRVNSASTVTYTATGLTNDTDYKFRIHTRDGAGNESISSNEVTVIPISTTATITVKRLGAATDYAKNGDSLAVECTYSQNTTSGKIFYQYLDPTGTTTQLASNTSSVNVISQSLSINSGSNGYKRINFWCEESGRTTSNLLYVTIDNNPPSISWNDTNATFIGAKKVGVTAIDTELIEKVEFDFNGGKISSTRDTSVTNIFYIDLNTHNFKNGSYSLSAKVSDKAGNSREITRTITISNALPSNEDAALKISQANIKKSDAQRVLDNAKSLGLVISESMRTKKASADEALAEAEEDLVTAPANALVKATLANSLYDEFKASTNFRDANIANYTFDNANTENLITALGIPAQNAKTIAQTVNGAKMARRLVIVETGDSNTVQVKVEIEFTNNTESGKVKIVEYIPKELLDSAKKIKMVSHSWSIIKDDPVVEFTVDVAKGAKATVRYGLGEMTSDAAKALIATNVIAKFEAPPLLIEGTSSAADLTRTPLVDDGTMMIIAVIIIIIIIVLVVVFFIKFKGGSGAHGFGAKKSIIDRFTPEQKPEAKKWEANKP